MFTKHRTDYDEIAHLYDSHPYRQKETDPHLLVFLADRPELATRPSAMLDISCGTGNQLVANRPVVPSATLVGLDLSFGMLGQARRKATDIVWVQADACDPPLPLDRFDFISHQFAFHHILDKPAMLEAAFGLLRSGGRFVMTNIAPQAMPGWIYYHYFPAARTRDLQDFLDPQAIQDLLHAIGFGHVRCDLDQSSGTQDLAAWLPIVSQRETTSHLTAISDQAYALGIQQLKADLQQGKQLATTELCLLSITAEK